MRRFISSSLHPTPRRFYAAPTDGAYPPNKVKYIPTSGTYPKGFLAGSAHAGVKPSNTKFDDLALIASDTPCNVAAVFTQNVFRAAPVNVSKWILSATRGTGIKSVVVNSGCANAVTGKKGLEDAIAMSKATDDIFAATSTPDADRSASNDLADPTPSADQSDHDEIVESVPDANQPASDLPGSDEIAQASVAGLKSLVMSTGVIGQPLPIEKITTKIPELHASLGNTHDHWLRAARAICTTDTFPKLISRQFTLPSHPETVYSIAGMTKGAGMIHPNMATLLSMITTDCKITPAATRTLLRAATDSSFNSISIDGDTSTNDTCALLANGAAAPRFVKPITVKVGPFKVRGKVHNVTASLLEEQSLDYRAFDTVLKDFMVDLAQLVVRDGEGATKFVTVRVEGAYSNSNAKRIANSIACSSLVKTALYGKDANWGRILCAVGYTRENKQVKPEWTSVSFVPADRSEELKLLVRGEPEQVDEERAKQILEMEDLEILVRLDDGNTEDAPRRDGRATMWTCDFSHEYVTINGDYRT